MNKIPSITVKFLGNEAVVFKYGSLKDIAVKLLSHQQFINLNPLLIQFSTGKQLYFDENEFQSFIDDEITAQQLMEATQCESLYRNMDDLVSRKTTIDAGALWKCNGETLTLIDIDNQVTTMLNLSLFQMIE
jgi:hypothetical protein